MIAIMADQPTGKMVAMTVRLAQNQTSQTHCRFAARERPPLAAHRLRIDDDLNAAITSPAGIGPIRYHRMAAAMTDDKELPGRHPARPRERVVDRHRLGNRQMLTGRI